MQADSFDVIYQTYFDPVYRYALSLSGNPQSAEEITQETFFRAMRSLNQFKGKSSLKSWLCAIAKNLWLSKLRKKKTQPIDDTPEFFGLCFAKSSGRGSFVRYFLLRYPIRSLTF